MLIPDPKQRCSSKKAMSLTRDRPPFTLNKVIAFVINKATSCLILTIQN